MSLSSRKRKSTAGGPAAKKRIVGPNDLQWENIAEPGFPVIEEVSGVEVINDNNIIKFAVVDDEKSKPQTEIVHEEWDGFGDDEADQSKQDDEIGSDGEDQEEQGDEIDSEDESEDVEPGSFTALADVLTDDPDDDGADISAWRPLDLSDAALFCVRKLGFAKPTEIQSASIPEILAGHDVIGTAATGSGKTLAYAIPILQKWADQRSKSDAEVKKPKRKSNSKPKTPTALILSPTRALAHQISLNVKSLCKPLGDARPRTVCITGGFSDAKQLRGLQSADIVVATPGRLWDLLDSNTPLLDAMKGISFLVVDEADRLLSDGHFKDAKEILAALDNEVVDMTDEYETANGSSTEAATPTKKRPSRQTLVFSATFHQGLQKKLRKKSKGWDNLAGREESFNHIQERLNFREESPTFIDANPASHLTENLYEGTLQCGATEKDLFLYSLLLLQRSRRTIIFANSINTVERLQSMLSNLDIAHVMPLHSQLGGAAQLKAIERFSEPEDVAKAKFKPPRQRDNSRPTTTNYAGRILVATDIAARGLDIPSVDMIVHYHVPHTADAYVHRSGRTARAGKSGLSVLLCSPAEVEATQTLIKQVHHKVAEETTDNGKKDKKSKGDKKKPAYVMHRVILDRKLVSEFRERVELAKEVADHFLVKNKQNKDKKWSEWAQELGTEYNPDDYAQPGASGTVEREKYLRDLTKHQIRSMRFNLRNLVGAVANAGIAYPTTFTDTRMDKTLRDANQSFLADMGYPTET